MAALAKVIDTGVADHGASNNRVWTVEHEQVVGGGERCLAVIPRLNITQIAVVALLDSRPAMRLPFGVPVRPRRRAPIAQVSCNKKMHVICGLKNLPN